MTTRRSPPRRRQLKDALQAGDVVPGGGNARLLKTLPAGACRSHNANALCGGYRLWTMPDGGATRARFVH